MTLDEHPEELLDQALAGGLAGAGRATLDRHLLSCSACAAHLTHARAFDADVAAQPRDATLDRRAIDAAVRRTGPATRRARPVPAWWRWAAAAVLLMIGSAGAALIVRPSRSPAVVAPPEAAPAPAAKPALARAVDPMVEPAMQAAKPPVSAVATPSAGALFERGGELRRRGEREAAVAVYRRLQQIHPGARETRLSFALAGRLLLDAGRPADALAQFDRYLAGGGGVDEEALVGRATALEQLGRSRDAAAAWRKLLDRHPQSIYAEHARARIEQLSASRR